MTTIEIFTRETYQREVKLSVGEKYISLCDLISVIIELYGSKSQVDSTESISLVDSTEDTKSITTDNLEKILDIILTPDCAKMANLVTSNDIMSAQLNFQYNTIDGEGYITERKD